jgi:hypothetical protein
MSLIKFLLTSILSLVALICIAVLVIFWSPSLQHTLALRALDAVGKNNTLAEINLSWNSLTLRGFSTQISGYGISLEALDLKARFLSFLGGKLIEVDVLDITGARVDLPKSSSNSLANETSEEKSSKKSKNTSKEIMEELDDLKNADLLPCQVAIKSLKIDAAIVSFADDRVLTANVSAANIVPGHKGQLNAFVNLNDGSSSQAEVKILIDIEQSAPKDSRSLAVSGTLSASGQTDFLQLGDAFKSMSSNGHFAVHVTSHAIDLTDLNIQISNSFGVHLLTANILSPLRIPLDQEWELALRGLSGNVAQLHIEELDLKLLKVLYPKDMMLAGQIQPFALTLNAAMGVLRGTITPAIVVSNLDLNQDGQPVFKSLNIAISAALSMESSKMTLNIPSISLSTQLAGKDEKAAFGKALGAWLSGNALAIMDLNGGENAFQGNADISLNLVGAKSQPVLAELSQLEGGTLELKIQVQSDEKFSDIRFVSDLGGQNIKSFTAKDPVNCKVHAEGSVDAKGVIDIQVPIFLKGLAGETDVNAKVRRDNAGAISGALSSRALYVDDCMILADAFAVKSTEEKKTTVAPSSTQTPGATRGIVPDLIPFWGNNLNADLKVKIDHIIQNRLSLLEKIDLSLMVTPQKCSLDRCTAKLTGAPITSSWILAFDPQKAKSPYNLNGSFDLKDLDVATLYKALAQSGRPPMTGFLNASGEAHGTGATLQNLMDYTQGKVTVTGTGGTFYLLDAAGSAGQVSKGAVAIAGVLNAATGSKVGQLDTLSRLLQLLNKIDYKVLRIHAQRKSDLNLVLDDLTVEGPTLAIYGKGQITHQPKISISNQPLNVQASLFAKGDTASLLKDVRLLDSNTPNAGGYLKGPTFIIGGTPAQPDFSGLYNIISKAAIGVATTGKTIEQTGDIAKQQVNQLVKGIGSLF